MSICAAMAGMVPSAPRIREFEAPFVFGDPELYREILNTRNTSRSDDGTTGLVLKVSLVPYGFSTEGSLCDVTPNAIMLRELRTRDWLCFVWTPLPTHKDTDSLDGEDERVWMFKATRNPIAGGTVQLGWAPKCFVHRVAATPLLHAPTPHPPPSIPLLNLPPPSLPHDQPAGVEVRSLDGSR